MDLARRLRFASVAIAVGISGTAIAQTPATPPPAGAAAAQPAEQPEAPPEKRFAVIVSNTQYRSLRPVPSAGVSGRRMAEALRRAGFEVEELSDLTRSAFETAIRQLGTRLAGAQVSAFYYAGRAGRSGPLGGLCMEPVDAPAREIDDMPFECIPVGAVMRQLERATPTSLVFWDSELPPRGPGGTGAAAGRGRSMIATGSVFVYGAQRGEVIINPDASEQVSPFADALANAIAVPGADLLDALRQVRRDVRAATNGAQSPWFRYGIDDELVLVPRPVPQTAAEDPNARAAGFSLSWQTRTPPPDPAALELAAWNSVISMRSDNARRAGLMDFLQRFPSGQYASLARINLEDLDRPAAPTASQPPDPLTIELAEWTSVQSFSGGPQRRAALLGYLQRYPTGRFAPLARLQLAEMNEPAPPAPAPATAQPAQSAPTPPASPTAAPAAAAAPTAAQQAAAGQPGQRYMVVRRANLRAEGNQDSRLIRGLEPFTTVILRGRYIRDQWVEVQVGNERGYLVANMIKDVREAEEEEWARIRDSRDRATFEVFLRRFPNGYFVNEATRRRDQLARATPRQDTQQGD